jgi:peptidyl-dipeptidase Dcp
MEVNERLRAHILSDGNSIDRAEAYRRFRGRDPDVRALFEARGFIPFEPVESAPSADY